MGYLLIIGLFIPVELKRRGRWKHITKPRERLIRIHGLTKVGQDTSMGGVGGIPMKVVPIRPIMGVERIGGRIVGRIIGEQRLLEPLTLRNKRYLI